MVFYFDYYTMRELWTEKYRPRIISELKLNESLKRNIDIMLTTGEITNSIFKGSPGTGKTATMRLIVESLYGKDSENYVCYISSDVKNVDYIVEKMNRFITRKTIRDIPKLIVIDDIDNISLKSQTILNSIDYGEDTNFIYIVSDLKNVHTAIQSNSYIYNFVRLESELIRERLEEILNIEGIKYDESLDLLIDLSEGDMRQAINYTQIIVDNYKKITESNIKKLFMIPDKEDIKTILYSKDISKRYKSLVELYKLGYTNEDICIQMLKHLYSCEENKMLNLRLMKIITDMTLLLNTKTNSRIQIYGMVYDLFNVSR